MDGFPQQRLHIFCPGLFLVYIIEIFEISQQMSQTYLIVEEVNGEVRAVAVCHCDHILQRVTEAFFKDFGATASAPEHESQIRCLRNPWPVELPIGVTSRFVEAHYWGFLYHSFYQGNGRAGFFKHLTDDIGQCPLTDSDIEHRLKQRLQPFIRHTLHHAQIGCNGTYVFAEDNSITAPATRCIITIATSAATDFFIKSAFTIDWPYLRQIHLLGDIFEHPFNFRQIPATLHAIVGWHFLNFVRCFHHFACSSLMSGLTADRSFWLLPQWFCPAVHLSLYRFFRWRSTAVAGVLRRLFILLQTLA